MISKKTDFSKQFRYLQLEKTWVFETEMPIKNIGIQFIQGYGKKVWKGKMAYFFFVFLLAVLSESFRIAHFGMKS